MPPLGSRGVLNQGFVPGLGLAPSHTPAVDDSETAAATQAAKDMTAPVTGRITSEYGWRTDPFRGDKAWHAGMWIRPSAVYQGNDNDTVTVISTNTSAVSGSASGTFSSDIVVRVDSSNANFAAGSTFNYSYSLDGGVSWVEGNTSGVCDGTSSTLSVPGGLLTLTNSGGTVSSGSQFLIQPSTADISIAISDTDSVVVNGVGKDIFGGVYKATGASNASVVTFNGSDSANLLESVGKLIGYLETNNQDGIEATLEDLTASQNQILEVAASVGGRENRVTSAGDMVSMLKDNANTTLSSVEDADLTELMLYDAPNRAPAGKTIPELRYGLDCLELARLFVLGTTPAIWETEDWRPDPAALAREVATLPEGFGRLRELLDPRRGSRKILFLPDVAGGVLFDLLAVRAMSKAAISPSI